MTKTQAMMKAAEMVKIEPFGNYWRVLYTDKSKGREEMKKQALEATK